MSPTVIATGTSASKGVREMGAFRSARRRSTTLELKRFPCKRCGGVTRVYDVSFTEEETIRRFRQCITNGCEVKFTTIEAYEGLSPFIREEGRSCFCVCHTRRWERLLVGVTCDRCGCEH